MALQNDAIENRLQGLRQEDRRPLCDRMLRPFRLDGKSHTRPIGQGSRSQKKECDEFTPELIVSLLEDIARRIDGLEKADRDFNREIRRRARWDSVWRILVTVASFSVGAVLAGQWLVHML